jgi:hypothetical protein
MFRFGARMHTRPMQRRSYFPVSSLPTTCWNHDSRTHASDLAWIFLWLSDLTSTSYKRLLLLPSYLKVAIRATRPISHQKILSYHHGSRTRAHATGYLLRARTTAHIYALSLSTRRRPRSARMALQARPLLCFPAPFASEPSLSRSLTRHAHSTASYLASACQRVQVADTRVRAVSIVTVFSAVSISALRPSNDCSSLRPCQTAPARAGSPIWPITRLSFLQNRHPRS